MLEVRGVDADYGPVPALRGVDLELHRGEIVCLIGANGAGKTTLLNVISALHGLSAGEVRLDGKTLLRPRPARMVAGGVVQVPEGRQLFGPLTVRENLELGAFLRQGRQNRRQVAQDMATVMELFPVLAERENQHAGTLSGGEQQMLAIGRGMMARPRALLLDEPSLGLAPLVVREIFRIIAGLPDRGCAVLLVEQNALGALSVAQRAYVMVNGRIAASGPSAELMADGEVKKAFLGGGGLGAKE